MSRAPEHIINQQILTWSEQLKTVERGGRTAAFWPIITVSREFGARGAALAEILAERTGFSVWNKELVHAVAQESGTDERILKTLDEHRQRMIEDAVRGALTGRYTNMQYLRGLMRVVHTIAAHGSSIIVGRGANHICKLRGILRLRVVCPFEARVRGYAERQGIDPRQARKIIRERDTDRAEFIRRTFRKNIEEPSNYDVILNSGTCTLDQLADIALFAYETKVGRRLPQVHHAMHA